MREPRRQPQTAKPAPAPLLFASGEARAIADLLALGVDHIPVLTRPLAVALQAELAPLVTATAARSTAAVAAFVAEVERLFPADTTAVAETLLVLLALDGLVAPLVRRLLLHGDKAPANIIAIATGGADGADAGSVVPFLRACVRPSTQAPAALFCCGNRFPLAAHLHGLFTEHSVRITIGSLAEDRSLVVDGMAQRPLLRIGALSISKSVGEYTARSTLPQVTPATFAALREASLALATAVLSAPEGANAFAESVVTAGVRVSPGLDRVTATEAALGVLNHGLAEAWHSAGVLPLPPQYDLGSNDGPVASQRTVTWV